MRGPCCPPCEAPQDPVPQSLEPLNPHTPAEPCSCGPLLRPGEQQRGGSQPAEEELRRADWVKPAARQGGGRASLLAAAVSSDGAYLAVGGGDKKVHVFDARSGQHLHAYPGHRDIVTALAFREGTHTLLSGSFDRTVKIWSLDDGAYVDTLYGHQVGPLCTG